MLEAVKKRDSWKRVGRQPPFVGNLSSEAAEIPLLEAVNREQPVKTLQAGSAVMIFELKRFAVVLQLLVVPSCGNKCPIKPISNYPKQTCQ
jgi:hypothetical protein